MSRLLFATLALSLLSCAPDPKPDAPPTEAPKAPAVKLARPNPAWTQARVARAKAKLEASEAGKLVWAAIEAHGGLATWFDAGPLTFRFTYEPDGRPSRDTLQTIDTWSSRGRHWYWASREQQFGWDGTQAWYLGEKGPINPRFWTMTPFYFVGVPFVFADDGLTLTKEAPVTFEERTYDQVRVTFQAGTGDAPDDYYVVLIDQETRRVGGVRYIVSYKGFFPNGGHTPEKFMKYDGSQTVGKITFPKTFRTFPWVDGAPGPQNTRASMTEVSFEPDRPASFFEMPKGATVFAGWMGKG